MHNKHQPNIGYLPQFRFPFLEQLQQEDQISAGVEECMEQEGHQKFPRRPNQDVSIRFNSALTRTSCLGNPTKKTN